MFSFNCMLDSKDLKMADRNSNVCLKSRNNVISQYQPLILAVSSSFIKAST